MQDVLENTGNTISLPQRSGRMSTIFREYRNHFGLFWRVMLPIIVFSLIFNTALFLLFKVGGLEAQWTFNTSPGIKVQFLTAFDRSSGTFQPIREPIGARASVGFNGGSFDIGFLWLVMCPLAFVIVHHYRNVNATSGEAWRQTRRKTVSILGTSVLFGVFATVGLFTIFMPILIFRSQSPISHAPPALSTPILLLMVVGIPMIYFLVKWSLYNQCIIIENLSAIAALRRSGELTRGKWWQFFGMYLLLVWGTMVFTTVVLSLTLLLFSVAAPEFAPLREVLQSGKFFGLFFGGKVGITLESAPVWAIGTMVAVNTLIHAILAPIWALLTTHLYMERAGTEQNAISD